MELRHLRYFVRVADELHFGRAADQLGISQPPLSQQIRQLEAELGVALFERTSRKVLLTEAGRVFLDEARATLARAEVAVMSARRAAEGETGTLSIGLSASSLFVPAVAATIAEYRRRYPHVHIDLAERPFALQYEGMASGAVDIGLLRAGHRPALPAGIAARPFAEDRMVLAVPVGHRLAADDSPIPVAALAGEPIVHYPYDRDGFLEDLWRLFETAGMRPNIVQEAHEVSALFGLVAAGLGITVIAGPLARLRVDGVCYRPLADAAAVSRIWLLHDAIRPRACASRLIAMIEPHLDGGDAAANAAPTSP